MGHHPCSTVDQLNLPQQSSALPTSTTFYCKQKFLLVGGRAESYIRSPSEVISDFHCSRKAPPLPSFLHPLTQDQSCQFGLCVKKSKKKNPTFKPEKKSAFCHPSSLPSGFSRNCALTLRIWQPCSGCLPSLPPLSFLAMTNDVPPPPLPLLASPGLIYVKRALEELKGQRREREREGGGFLISSAVNYAAIHLSIRPLTLVGSNQEKSSWRKKNAFAIFSSSSSSSFFRGMINFSHWQLTWLALGEREREEKAPLFFPPLHVECSGFLCSLSLSRFFGCAKKNIGRK